VAKIQQCLAYTNQGQRRKAVDNHFSGLSQWRCLVLLPDIESSEKLSTRKEHQAPEGATTGVAAGGAAGGALGLLVGLGSPGNPRSGTIPRSRANCGRARRIRGGGAVGGMVGALVGGHTRV
jgi:hypothetical protein